MSLDIVKARNINNGHYTRNKAGLSCCISTLLLVLTPSSSQICTLLIIDVLSSYLDFDSQTTSSSKEDTGGHTTHLIL